MICRDLAKNNNNYYCEQMDTRTLKIQLLINFKFLNMRTLNHGISNIYHTNPELFRPINNIHFTRSIYIMMIYNIANGR